MKMFRKSRCAQTNYQAICHCTKLKDMAPWAYCIDLKNETKYKDNVSNYEEIYNMF